MLRAYVVLTTTLGAIAGFAVTGAQAQVVDHGENVPAQKQLHRALCLHSRAIAEFMKSDGSAVILIVGHADSRGDDPRNRRVEFFRQ